MKSGLGHHEVEDEAYEDFGSRKDAMPSTNTKDGKNNDKANATRSKHSVTEQRRRSKINERFQMLRELIPNSDQKRDTASFLLEVIDYVQYLQEKMQKYEGSCQGWSSEPTKLMPWRNNHWRVQSFVGNPQAVKNDPGPGSTYSGRSDENNPMHTNPQNPIEYNGSRDSSFKLTDHQPELANKGMVMPIPLSSSICIPNQGDDVFTPPLSGPVSDANLSECAINGDTQNHQEDLTIEGGTINISSVYSQGLLNTLAQALESAGLDLTQATIQVQVDLGKRAITGLNPGISLTKAYITAIMGGFCSCFHVPEEDQDDGSDASNDQHGTCLDYLKTFKNKCGVLFANAGSQTTNSPAAQQPHVAARTNAPPQVTVGNYNGVRICSSAINSDVQLSVAVSNNGVRIRSSQGPAERMNVRVNLPSKSSKVNSGRNSKGKKAEARHSASSVKVSSGKVETAAPKYVFPVEEDVCPTCLDEFTAENPKIISRCNHQFHLACIYEWMERSPTCPVCMRMMIFDE